MSPPERAAALATRGARCRSAEPRLPDSRCTAPRPGQVLPSPAWPRCARATTWPRSPRRRPGAGHRRCPDAARRRRGGGDPEDRLEGRGSDGPDRPRRSGGQGRAGRAGVRPRPAPSGRAAHHRDPPGLHVRQRRCRPVERRATGTAALLPVDADRSARRIRAGLQRRLGVDVGVDRLGHVRAALASGRHRRGHRLRRAWPPSSTSAGPPTRSAGSWWPPRSAWPTRWRRPPSWSWARTAACRRRSSAACRRRGCAARRCADEIVRPPAEDSSAELAGPQGCVREAARTELEHGRGARRQVVQGASRAGSRPARRRGTLRRTSAGPGGAWTGGRPPRPARPSPRRAR